MGTPYLGEIRATSFAFAPKGWAMCNGQILSIQQNTALFAILGTTYGGNGQTTFGLPDLRGRVPVHRGSGSGWTAVQGQVGGEVGHTLTVAEMPSHTHTASGSSAAANTGSPAGAVWATTSTPAYTSVATTAMSSAATATSGGGQPHENRPPFLTLNFVIALQGIFPTQS